MLPAQGELLRAEAFQLLDAYGAGKLGLVVPDIFWAECGTVLGKAVRQQRLSRADADLAVLTILRRAIPTISSVRLLPEALAIALNYGRSVYDCLYVALAAQTRKQLITADERLANAMAAYFPVKWLGAF
jgi:predicted nucleic acid-binding protein